MGSRDTIRFLDFQLDRARGELFNGDQIVPVEPQVLDLIAELASHTGVILSRDQLIETVWNGRIVSDSAIASRINAARAALGDDGTAQSIIKTIPKRGYRFEATVEANVAEMAPTLPDKPSIAVLPFQNMSDDPEQTYFSDGITDDIITDLSRYGELFVIARHSSFAYRESLVPTVEIARELKVQYIAEGSVRRAGNRIRVTARLIDPWAGNEIWAERYDRDQTDIFEIQDEITSMIVNRLAGQIARQHRQRSLDKSSESVTAYEHVLRAMELVWNFDTEIHMQARKEAHRALELDTNSARAHAVLAWSHLYFAHNVAVDDPDDELRRSYEAAQAAVAADDREPWAHATLGWAIHWKDHATERAFAELDRAISLNPGNVTYRSLKAFSLTYAGQSELALSELTEAMRVNPHFPASYHIFCGRALFNMKRYAEAVLHLDRIRIAQPNHANALALAAAGYAANGQAKDAKATIQQVQSANPHFTISYARRFLPYSSDDDREHFLSMLARAGLPE